ncbi:hypothetical protein CsatB_019867 [Cannabis sativa]
MLIVHIIMSDGNYDDFSHGFMMTHKWRETIDAFINVEAFGIGGPDLVCQSGMTASPVNLKVVSGGEHVDVNIGAKVTPKVQSLILNSYKLSAY